MTFTPETVRLTRTTYAVGSGKLVNLPEGTLVNIIGANYVGTSSQTLLVETVDGNYGAEVAPSYLTPA